MAANKAPLWEALLEYRKAGVIPFHTPGHKLHSGNFPALGRGLGEDFFALDPSDEVQAPQWEHQFEDVLAEAQNLAAAAFKAAGTFFLVNGTTGGIAAALLPFRGRVLLPRFSHQAAYSALALAGAEPCYIPTKWDSVRQLPLQPTAAQWQEALERYRPQAAFLTHPTYYGTVADLPRCAELCRSYNCTLVVDEAHGAHFGFHPELPPTAMECGADFAVQSTHKTLGSPTGSSMLHCRDPRGVEMARRSLEFLQTTSPSLVFLGALDEIRRAWQDSGRCWMDAVLARAHGLEQALAAIPGVTVLNAPGRDPTKVLFSLASLGLDGRAVERHLRWDYGIQLELSDHYWALALLSVGDTDERIRRLAEAVQELAQRAGGSPGLAAAGFALPELPRRVLGMNRAAFGPCRRLPLETVCGAVSGTFVTPYPPGVPLLVPGEIWTEAIAAFVRQALDRGWHVRGLAEDFAVVVEDQASF